MPYITSVNTFFKHRDLFTTQSNIYDEIIGFFYPLTNFAKKGPLWIFYRVLNILKLPVLTSKYVYNYLNREGEVSREKERRFGKDCNILISTAVKTLNT